MNEETYMKDSPNNRKPNDFEKLLIDDVSDLVWCRYEKGEFETITNNEFKIVVDDCLSGESDNELLDVEKFLRCANLCLSTTHLIVAACKLVYESIDYGFIYKEVSKEIERRSDDDEWYEK